METGTWAALCSLCPDLRPCRQIWVCGQFEPAAGPAHPPSRVTPRVPRASYSTAAPRGSNFRAGDQVAMAEPSSSRKPVKIPWIQAQLPSVQDPASSCSSVCFHVTNSALADGLLKNNPPHTSPAKTNPRTEPCPSLLLSFPMAISELE